MISNRDWLFSRIGDYLYEARVEAGLSQSEVSKKLGYKNSQYLSNIERGTCNVSPDIIRKLIRLYHLTESQAVEDIMTIQQQYLEAELRGKKLKLSR